MNPRSRSAAFLATAWAALLPSLLNACPRCFNSSPNHRGLIIGVLFLLPLPFILIGLIAWRIRRSQDQEDHAAKNL